ncbi:glycosyltransferase family 4 protein [Pelagibius litoralis]|uniref:Glycosyltransferase family 4 protein n=1 Tax=Pelagibius litoralis TaxID=374515 RepID=A0A967CCH3_9PROT|nr:glycosyltransferase family 4 protein [Pelagibius litoralis]NIA69073.1 glycosyltransferase family 4 protein [Pelagibius litoralis]
MSVGGTHLFLFMTEGMSLAKWRDLGMLRREIALYENLRPHLAGITIVSYGDREDAALASAFSGIDVLCNRWGLPQGIYRRLLPGLLRRARRGAAAYKSNQTSGAALALSLARRNGACFLARCGYMLSDFKRRAEGKDSAAYKNARALERDAFIGADRCVVTTEAMKDEIVGYGVPSDRVSIVPNYVDTALFKPSPPSHDGRRRVAFIGRLTAQKNPLLLIRALAGLEAELDIVGQGELRAEIEAEAARCAVAVTFHGNLQHERLPEIINTAGLFVLPSHYEGHPKTLLEAMACGAAVVGTDVSGIREVIDDEKTGLLCRPEADALRSAIARLLDDAALRRRLGEGARAHIEAKMSLDRIVELELAAYQAALAQRTKDARLGA